MPTYSDETGDIHYPLAGEYARKALALDPTIAEAYAVLAENARDIRNWIEAEELYRQAIKHEPKNSTSYLWYAEHLHVTGRRNAALQAALVAYQLDPLHAGTNQVLGEIYESLGDYANTEKHSKNAWDAGHFSGLFELISIKMLHGDFKSAISMAAQLDVEFGNTDDLMVMRVKAYENASLRAAFFDALEADPEDRNLTYFLPDYVNFGRMDDAYAIASTPDAFIANTWFSVWRHDTVEFRKDPRFADLAKAAGFIDYWNEYGWPPACAPSGDTITCQ
jgi:hypothetical protein